VGVSQGVGVAGRGGSVGQDRGAVQWQCFRLVDGCIRKGMMRCNGVDGNVVAWEGCSRVGEVAGARR
jgi:hypothetical protein